MKNNRLQKFQKFSKKYQRRSLFSLKLQPYCVQMCRNLAVLKRRFWKSLWCKNALIKLQLCCASFVILQKRKTSLVEASFWYRRGSKVYPCNFIKSRFHHRNFLACVLQNFGKFSARYCCYFFYGECCNFTEDDMFRIYIHKWLLTLKAISVV